MRTRAICCAVAIVLIRPLATAQWVQTSGPYRGTISRFAVSDTCLFAGTHDYGGVFLSTNNGTSWTAVDSGLTTSFGIYALAVSGANLFVGNVSGDVFLSTNNGTSWTAVGLTFYQVRVLTICPNAAGGTNLYAGTYGAGVFLSTNNGTSWTAVSIGLTNRYVTALAANGSDLFAGTFGGVFRSTNNGSSWTAVNDGLVYMNTTPGVDALAVLPDGGGTNLFAYGVYVYLSTDNGANWTAVGSLGGGIGCFAVSGTNIFVGTTAGGVFHSTDCGTSWTDVGLTYTSIYSLAVSSDTDGSGMYLIASTNWGVWRRPLSEMVVTVPPASQEMPQSLELSQNYPNPFNPSTTIKYALPLRSYVTLTVFNPLGQQVATLVNAEVDAGVHEARFNGTGLASGVYLYRLQAGEFVQAKKLVIVK